MTTYVLNDDVDLPAHPAADIFPMLADDELEALAADIAENGLELPVCTYKGTVLDGRNRIKACRMAGVPVIAQEFEGDDMGALDYAFRLNMRRRHLTPSQINFANVRYKTLHGYVDGGSNQFQTKVVPPKAGPDGPASTKAGPSGPASSPPPLSNRQLIDTYGGSMGGLRRAGIVETQGIDALKQLVMTPGTDLTITEAARIAQLPPDDQLRIIENRPAHVKHNSGDNEWYTPVEYIKAAFATMGSIDLDPASSEVANERVQATRIFTQEDDGRKQEWHGHVWMNPPYAQPLISDFCKKLTDEYEAGNVTGACVLVNNATETGWFQGLAAVASAVCFPKGRVKFWHPDKVAAPLQGQAVLYLGSSPGKFEENFKQFGTVWHAWES